MQSPHQISRKMVLFRMNSVFCELVCDAGKFFLFHSLPLDVCVAGRWSLCITRSQSLLPPPILCVCWYSLSNCTELRALASLQGVQSTHNIILYTYMVAPHALCLPGLFHFSSTLCLDQVLQLLPIRKAIGICFLTWLISLNILCYRKWNLTVILMLPLSRDNVNLSVVPNSI